MYIAWTKSPLQL